MKTEVRIEKLAQADIAATKALIEEYIGWTGLDLCFQGIDEEMETFPSKYREPEGAFLVAKEGGRVVGCVGMKKIEENVCEMKRLYVKDSHKGMGIGKALAEGIIDEAEKSGYHKMRLDTLKRMDRALCMYRAFGFHEIDQYVENPIEDAVFMEKELKIGARAANL
jgi:ribosomal protein S18 acetylase RimI-like enzyme